MKLSISALLFIFAVPVATAGEFGGGANVDKAMIEKKNDSPVESEARNAGGFDESALSRRRVSGVGRGVKSREDFGPTSNVPGLLSPTLSTVETSAVANPWVSAEQPANSMAEFPQAGVRYRNLQPSAVNGPAPQTVEMLDQMHGDVRLLVGDEAYSQMAWAYFDLKGLDASISSAMRELGLVGESVSEGMGVIHGLDDQLLVLLVGAGKGSIGSRSMGLQGHPDVRGESSQGGGGAQQASFDDNFEEKSQFFRIFKYFTFLKCLYFSLILTASYVVLKGFRFVIRGRRSSK